VFSQSKDITITNDYYSLIEFCPILRGLNQQGSLIDWENSTFFAIDKIAYTFSDGKTFWHRLEENISIRNYQDYLKYLREIHTRSAGKQALKADHIQLKDKIEFDLFKMSIPMMGYFCSNRLKTAVEQTGFSGFCFEPVK
jgi:6-phosphogluconolactonase/glucosamine-6-phosphate isomerase/deaminase